MTKILPTNSILNPRTAKSKIFAIFAVDFFIKWKGDCGSSPQWRADADCFRHCGLDPQSPKL